MGPISDGGTIHLETTCPGGNRAWDCGYNPREGSLVFAAILKGKLLHAQRQLRRVQSEHGFSRRCLIVS